MTLLPPVEKCHITSVTELLSLPKSDKSGPSVTQYLSRDYELMTSLPPVKKYPMEPFQSCLPTVQI